MPVPVMFEFQTSTSSHNIFTDDERAASSALSQSLATGDSIRAFGYLLRRTVFLTQPQLWPSISLHNPRRDFSWLFMHCCLF